LVNLYAVQPLLPQFRSIFYASEVGVSRTISAPVLAVAMLAPFIGLIADTLGRKRIRKVVPVLLSPNIKGQSLKVNVTTQQD
jgi:MFS family permease